MISLSTETKEAEKHAEFPDIPTAAQIKSAMRGNVKGGMKANDIPYQIPYCRPIIAYIKGCVMCSTECRQIAVEY